MKALFILWLTLPQIQVRSLTRGHLSHSGQLTGLGNTAQGSTYIYTAHIHPFLSTHEAEIDAAVADAKGKARAAGLSWLNQSVKRVKEMVVGGLIVRLLSGASSTTADDGRAGRRRQRQRRESTSGFCTCCWTATPSRSSTSLQRSSSTPFVSCSGLLLPRSSVRTRRRRCWNCPPAPDERPSAASCDYLPWSRRRG